MKRTKRRHPLFIKILVPILLVMLFQSVIFFAATVYGGVSSTLRQNAEAVLAERVATQKNSLETLFSNQWSNLSTPASSITTIYDQVQAAANAPVYASSDLQKQVLAEAAPALISMLRANEVTGVFLILNDAPNYVAPQSGATVTKYGLCVRDYTPTAEYTSTEDLQVIRGPSAITTQIKCSLEASWEALYDFTDANPGDYYYKPLQLAYENPGVDITNLAYFYGAHRYATTDRAVVSYSLPLVDATGYPYGVLGIELTTDYLKTLIPSSTLHSNSAGCYALVQYMQGSDEYTVVTYDGVIFQQCFGDAKTFCAEPAENGMLLCKDTRIGADLCGSRMDLTIYNHNTPFEAERLALIGLVRTDSLYSVSLSVQNRLLVVSIAVLLIGVLAVLVISQHLTQPINQLSARVRNMDGEAPPQLDRLNIDEIDDLVESIEGLSEKVSRNAVRTEFFSRMSHDMRTPMNAIIGFSSPEVLEGADLATAQEYLRKIHSSGNYLLTLINEVLDMTKIESQRMELREEALTVPELLSGVVPMIQELAKEKNVNFVVVADTSSQRFLADRQRVVQVLMNLLSNAVKFTDAGGTVRLEYRELLHDGDRVTHSIIVQDTGCGMSEAFQKKMYEPFSQESGAHGGTGLGLSIARQLVLLMGGTLSCESAPGAGTKFTIRITSKATDQAPATLPTVAAAKPETDLSGKRVLVCEDHPLNMQIARRLLERKGLEVDEAADGVAGLAKFRASPVGGYDLILMDIRMPEMNGLDTTIAIRQLDRADAKTVPIIAMTANAFKEDVDASRKAGMNEHLSKPIDPQILYLTLQKYLG